MEKAALKEKKEVMFLIIYTEKEIDTDIHKSLLYHVRMAELTYGIRKKRRALTVDGRDFYEYALEVHTDEKIQVNILCGMLGIKYFKGETVYITTL